MIEQLVIRDYDLPLRHPWVSAKGGFERRRGFAIEVRADGLSGFGDCAPLPGTGTERLEQARTAVSAVQARLRGISLEALMNELGTELDAAPAARFALECALLDLASRRAGTSLRHRLSATARDRVPVNAMAGPLDRLTAAEIRRYREQGFRVLKVKVGLEEPERELQRLGALVAELPPDMGLRLDANGAWDLADARRMLSALVRWPVESLEEPLREPTSAQLAELQASVPFPLARDESLPTAVGGLDPASLGVRRLVLKPAVIGGLRRTLELARAAIAQGVEVVVTSLVETAAGLWPTAQLAAATGSAIPHGLATAEWLAKDLGSAPLPRDGFIQLPLAAGSGFAPRA